MKIAAIIAEYNPFHKGHQFQIAETRRITGADYIIVLMSGDFVQRGTPALCNKYLRTRMALAGGADVVLELPSLYAVSSAEFFAQGSVTLLDKLGVIHYLSFGSECGNINVFTNCAAQLLSPTKEQETLTATLNANGMSYPLARQQALIQTLSACPDTASRTVSDTISLLSSPNNILGLEYCKALLSAGSSILPVTIQRKGGNYHDTTLSSDSSHFASASAIRLGLHNASVEYFSHLPETVLKIFKEEQIPQTFLTEDSFSLLLYYKLLSEQNAGFTGYLDCSQELSDKIRKYLPDYRSFSQFCNLLKSKNLTYTRISRTLLHILLNIQKPESYHDSIRNRSLPVPYVRLLGFQKKSSPVLSAIKQNSSIPLISNLADASKVLTEKEFLMLKQDIYVCNVYEAVFSAKNNREPLNEYHQSPVIL